MSQDSSITQVGAELRKTERPDSQSLINLMIARFRAGAMEGVYKGVAIIFDVKIIPPGESEKTDAIQVNVDHESGYSAQVFYPYSIAADGTLRFGNVFAQRGNNQIFGGQ